MKVNLVTPPVDRVESMGLQWNRGKGATKELLEDLYVTKKMTIKDIGKYFSISDRTIRKTIIKQGITLRKNYIDLKGMKIGRWNVLDRVENKAKYFSIWWLCRCDCGKEKIVQSSSLRLGKSTSCGCYSQECRRARNGANHPSFRTGKWTNSGGYKILTDKTHPNRTKRGYVFEHIAIMTKHIGRALLPGETVHHKNGIRDDNRIENLELWSNNHSNGERVVDMITFCVDYLKIYAPEKLVKEELCEFN